MNRKIYRCALAALMGGSITFAAAPAAPPPAPAAPAAVAPAAPAPAAVAPAAVAPAAVAPAAPAPAAVAPAAPAPAAVAPVAPAPAVPDATAAQPATTQPAPTLPDPITLAGIFAEMGIEGATRNYNALAGDVAKLQPVHDLLSPGQQSLLDGAMATLKAAGVKIPDAAGPATTQSADDTNGGGGTSPVPDGLANLIPGAGGTGGKSGNSGSRVKPGKTPISPNPAIAGTPTADESPVLALINKTTTDVSAKAFNFMVTYQDSASLATAIKSSLTPPTLQKARHAMVSAVNKLLGSVQADLQAKQIPAAKAKLANLSAVADYPDDVKKKIAAYEKKADASPSPASNAPTHPKKR